MAAEKRDLEGRAQKLEENLKEAVHGHLMPVRHKIDADTPVDKVLSLLGGLMEVRMYLHCSLLSIGTVWEKG